MTCRIELHRWKSYRFEKGNRYYQLSIRQNLWGQWEIEKVNGGKSSQLGKIRYEPCKSYDEGIELLQQYRNYRIHKRHYEELTMGHIIDINNIIEERKRARDKKHFSECNTLLNESIKIMRIANPPRACGKPVHSFSEKFNTILSGLFSFKAKLGEKIQSYEKQ